MSEASFDIESPASAPNQSYLFSQKPFQDLCCCLSVRTSLLTFPPSSVSITIHGEVHKRNGAKP
jgi:hypothetical protein